MDNKYIVIRPDGTFEVLTWTPTGQHNNNDLGILKMYELLGGCVAQMPFGKTLLEVDDWEVYVNAHPESLPRNVLGERVICQMFRVKFKVNVTLKGPILITASHGRPLRQTDAQAFVAAIEKHQ